jgi:hypothetical protein
VNVPKAIELSLAKVLTEHADLDPGVFVRCWQTLTNEPEWTVENDRRFPLIELRCSPATIDDNERTLMVPCVILCATKTEDDASHDQISKLYEDVEQCIYRLYGQFIQGASGDEQTLFNSEMAAKTTATDYNFGGFTISDALAPGDDNGVNVIGMTLVTHYSRGGF